MDRRNGFASLVLLGLGAGLMYLLDPDMGNRRRSMIRDRAIGLRHDAEHYVDARVEDFRVQAYGVVADAAGRLAALTDEAEKLVRNVGTTLDTVHSESAISASQTAGARKPQKVGAGNGGEYSE